MNQLNKLINKEVQDRIKVGAEYGRAIFDKLKELLGEEPKEFKVQYLPHFDGPIVNWHHFRVLKHEDCISLHDGFVEYKVRTTEDLKKALFENHKRRECILFQTKLSFWQKVKTSLSNLWYWLSV
jgi:hypothetical protein